jgi:hypothetical protein
MNAFSTISRVLIVTAVVAVSAAQASDPGKPQSSKQQMMDEKVKRYLADLVVPVAVRELLKDQNPYISPVAEAAAVTWLHGHLPIGDRRDDQAAGEYSDAVKYFIANVSSRELAVFVAANTRFNKQYFADGCEDYVGAIPYVGQPVSKTIKKISPSIVETAHNSIAASVKTGKPTLELTISLI